MTRWFALLLVVLLCAAPALAQTEPDITDFIPADTTALVRWDVSRRDSALQAANLYLFIISYVQPARLQLSAQVNFDALFPLTELDLENPSFTRDVLPWLGDEIIVAYHTLNQRAQPQPDSTLLILPTSDAFRAAQALSAAIQAQDLLQRETYRGQTVYIGDQTTLVFTPQAVLIGAEARVKAALDAQAGAVERLNADPTYQAVRAALPANDPVFAYAHGTTAASLPAIFTSGSVGANAIFGALNDALVGLGAADALDRALLGGGIDALGVTVSFDALRRNNVRANLVFHVADAAPTTPAAEATTEATPEAQPALPVPPEFDASVLNLIPRSAMLVQSGADARAFGYRAMAALPLANWGGSALAAFGIPASQAAAGALNLPSGADIQAGIASLRAVLSARSGIDVFDDVLERAQGSYAFAALPRPNNPTPALNTPYDLLWVARLPDAESAAALSQALGEMLRVIAVPLPAVDETLEGYPFVTVSIAATGEPVARVGAADEYVIIGTGTAAEQALRALRGDNRLVRQERWQTLAADAIPHLYIDVNALFNALTPTGGGPTQRPLRQLGVTSTDLGAGMYQARLVITLA